MCKKYRNFKFEDDLDSDCCLRYRKIEVKRLSALRRKGRFRKKNVWCRISVVSKFTGHFEMKVADANRHINKKLHVPCEVHSVIHFLTVCNDSVTKIHRELFLFMELI